MPAKTAFVALALVLAVALVHASELAVGTVLRAPSGAEYVIGEELPYSPRLVAAKAGAANGVSMVQLNAHHKRVGAVTGALGADDYTMGQKIGQGGFGAIFKATRKHHSKAHSDELAIKVQTAKDAHELDVLKREYDVQMKLLRICPKHIVQVFEHWEQVPHHDQHTGGGKEYKFFMAMELMGGDLDHAMAVRAQRGDMRADVPSTLPYWHQMIDGIACLHNHGYVHRDIKGGNFLVSLDKKTVKVSDFGETRNGAQLREDLTKHKQIPYPHQTPLFNAPSAVVLKTTPATAQSPAKTTWSFIEPMKRTWAKRLQWDGYALGLSLLGVYYSADLIEISRHSTAPPLQGTGIEAYLQFFSAALKDETSYAKFVAGLDAKYNVKAQMPADMQHIVGGLLLEQLAVKAIDTTKAPFEKVTWSQAPLPPTTPSAAAAAAAVATNGAVSPSAAPTVTAAGPLSATVSALVDPLGAATNANHWAPRALWVSTPKQ